MIELLQQNLPSGSFQPAPSNDGMTTIYVQREQLVETMRVLRDRLNLKFLADILAVDYIPHEPRFEVVYLLASITDAQPKRLRVKVRVPGGETVYAIPQLPKDHAAPEDHLRRVLGDWVAEVAHSANLVVVRTPPGSAHVVASALDRAALPGSIGTVAGDDTVLIVASERTGGAKLARKLSELAGL